MSAGRAFNSETPRYEIREACSSDLEQILDLLRTNLSDKGVTAKTEAFWKWKHVDAPAGPSIVYVATEPVAGKVIGLRAAMRFDVLTPDGSLVKAIRPVDTATHQDWQRLGVFSRLTLCLIDGLRRTSTNLIFNTPNENSLPAYLRLGWRVVQVNKVRVKLGNPSLVLSNFLSVSTRSSWQKVDRHGSTLSIKPFAELDLHDRKGLLEVCTEYECLRKRRGMRTLRDVATLDWRYSHPLADYHVFRIQNADSGRPNAVVFFRFERRKGLRGALLTDFFHDSVISFDQLLRAACYSIDAGFFVACSIAGSQEDRSFSRNWFLPVRDIKLVQRTVYSDQGDNPANLGKWDISLADLELF